MAPWEYKKYQSRPRRGSKEYKHNLSIKLKKYFNSLTPEQRKKKPMSDATKAKISATKLAKNKLKTSNFSNDI